MANSGVQLESEETGCVSAGVSDAAVVQVTDSIQLPYLYPANLLQPGFSELSVREPSYREREFMELMEQEVTEQGSLEQEIEANLDEPYWWLVYTKSRQEKKLAEQLASRQVPHFLPVVKRKSLTRGKTRIAEIPLFSGYLFFHGNDQQRIKALQTNRIVAMTQVTDGEQLRGDLRRIAELIALDAPLTPESRLVEGQRVRVKAGLFAGYEGTVLKRRGKTRLFVAVEYMEMGASMEIQDYLLEPV